MLLDLMTDDESEISEEELHLWEDLLPTLMKLETQPVSISQTITLHETSIRSYLIHNGIPPKLVYGIMRVNGYSNGSQIVANDILLRIPVIEKLETLYDAIRRKN